MKIAIGICSLSCSGKDSVIDILSKYGFKKYSYTDLVLKPVSDKNNLPHARDSYRNLLIKLGSKADEILFEYVKKDDAEKIGIPNIRLKSSIDFWRNKSGFKFYLIKIVSDFEKRFERFNQRKRIDTNPLSIEEFKQLDENDMKMTDVKEILKKEKFDFIIENNGSLKDLEKKVEKMVTKILLNKKSNQQN